MRKFLLGLFCAVALGATSVAHAGPPFPLKSSLKFDANSKYALIVFQAAPQTVAARWKLEFFSFSKETNKWLYGLTSGWTHFSDVPAGSTAQYYASLVTPGGGYAINRISSQGFWAACYNGGTKVYKIEAGKVNYIGAIDPNPALKQIISELPPVTRGGKHLEIYDTPRPEVTPPSAQPGWEDGVNKYLQATFPQVKAEIVGREPEDTTFEPGKTMGTKTCEKY